MPQLLPTWSAEGKRVLAPATIKLMASKHVLPNLRSGEFGIRQHLLRYGFNCAVVFDPANDVLFAAMIQRMANPDNHSLPYRGHAHGLSDARGPFEVVPEGVRNGLSSARRRVANRPVL